MVGIAKDLEEFSRLNLGAPMVEGPMKRNSGAIDILQSPHCESSSFLVQHKTIKSWEEELKKKKKKKGLCDSARNFKIHNKPRL